MKLYLVLSKENLNILLDTGSLNGVIDNENYQCWVDKVGENVKEKVSENETSFCLWTNLIDMPRGECYAILEVDKKHIKDYLKESCLICHSWITKSFVAQGKNIKLEQLRAYDLCENITKLKMFNDIQIFIEEKINGIYNRVNEPYNQGKPPHEKFNEDEMVEQIRHLEYLGIPVTLFQAFEGGNFDNSIFEMMTDDLIKRKDKTIPFYNKLTSFGKYIYNSLKDREFMKTHSVFKYVPQFAQVQNKENLKKKDNIKKSPTF